MTAAAVEALSAPTDRGERRVGAVLARSIAGALLAATFLLAGCTGLSDIRQTAAFLDHYQAGEYHAASAVLGGETGLDYDEEQLLTSLHVALALRAAGRFADAQIAFDRAESQLLWKSDRIATVDDLLAVGLTLVGNDLMRSYRGTIYDGVLVNTYKALNAVALNDEARARVELNRADQRQANAIHQLGAKVRALAAQDAEEQEQTEEHTDAIDRSLEEVMDPSGSVARRLAAVAALGEYRDLRNPFTDWLHGVFRLATGEANRASDLLRNAAVLDGQRNRHVLSDLVIAERAADGAGAAAARVWIVHEDGTGPALDQFRFRFLVPTRHGPVGVGLALPEFLPGRAAVPVVEIHADDQVYATEPLLDVDRYAATEFRAGYDAVVFKAVASAVIRTILQVEIQKRTESDGLLGSLVELLVPVAAVVTTQADTRIWRALPHTIGVASLPRPAGGTLRVVTPGSGAVNAVALPPARYTLVTIKTTHRTRPPVVSVAAFGRDAELGG